MSMLNKKGNPIIYFLISLSFIVCLLITTIYAGQIIFTINPQDTAWNDEIFYLKQIEGIAEYGFPQGYFGYNQSEAAIGTLGAWSPVLMYMYSFFYVVFGRSFLSLYISNVIIIVGALFLFFKMLHLTYGKCLAYLVPFLSFSIVRFSYSAMPECLFYALILLCFGCWIDRDNQKKKKLGIMLIFLMTIMRPYLCLLFIPFFLKKKEPFKSTLVSLIWMLAGCMLYLIITNNFCATSLDAPLVEIKKQISSFELGSVGGIARLLSNFLGSIYNRVVWSLETLFNGQLKSEVYGAAVIYMLYYIICLVFLMFSIRKWKAEHISDDFVLFLTLIFMFCAVAFLNSNYTAGNRHLFPIMLFGWLYLIYMYLDKMGKLLLPTMLASILVSNIFYFRDPFYRWSSESSKQYIYDEIEKINVTDNFNDNTIVFEYGESVEERQLYRSLLNVNSGIGINLCTWKYLNDPDIIRYKYVMLSSTSKNNDVFEQNEKWEIMIKNDKYVIYQK